MSTRRVIALLTLSMLMLAGCRDDPTLGPKKAPTNAPTTSSGRVHPGALCDKKGIERRGPNDVTYRCTGPTPLRWRR